MAEPPMMDTRGWRGPESQFQLPNIAWASEYLRRNPRLRQSWLRTLSLRDEVLTEDQFRVVRLNREPDLATPMPCLFASSPDEDAATATVLWWPELNRNVLRAIAVQGTAAKSATYFHAREIPLPTTLLLAPDGSQHLVIRDGVRSLQLLVRGARLLDPVALMVDTAFDTPAFPEEQLNSLRCVRDLRSTGRIHEHHWPHHPRGDRFAVYLVALDGFLAGASQREIAVSLFGTDAVVEDWNDPRGHMRDRFRFTVLRGRDLMDHGYLAFLR